MKANKIYWKSCLSLQTINDPSAIKTSLKKTLFNSSFKVGCPARIHFHITPDKRRLEIKDVNLMRQGHDESQVCIYMHICYN